MKVIKWILIWYNILFLEKPQYKNYYLKHWKRTNHFEAYSGFGVEIINIKNNKVIYRYGNQNKNITSSLSGFKPFKQYFIRNV